MSTKKKVSKTKEIQKVQKKPAIEIDMQVLLMSALKNDLSVEKINQLLDLRDRVEKEQAEKEFRFAMSAFQGECPVIKKSNKVYNKDRVTVRYHFAPIDEIQKVVAPILKKYDLSYEIDIDMDYENKIVTALVTACHVRGHSKTTCFSAPIDSDAYMSEGQKWASAATFSKRHAFCNAFGIITGDEDDDNNDAEIDVEKVKNLPELIKNGFKDIGYTTAKIAYKFCERFGWDEKRIQLEINNIKKVKNDEKFMK